MGVQVSIRFLDRGGDDRTSGRLGSRIHAAMRTSMSGPAGHSAPHWLAPAGCEPAGSPHVSTAGEFTAARLLLTADAASTADSADNWGLRLKVTCTCSYHDPSSFFDIDLSSVRSVRTWIEKANVQRYSASAGLTARMGSRSKSIEKSSLT